MGICGLDIFCCILHKEASFECGLCDWNIVCSLSQALLCWVEVSLAVVGILVWNLLGGSEKETFFLFHYPLNLRIHAGPIPETSNFINDPALLAVCLDSLVHACHVTSKGADPQQQRKSLRCSTDYDLKVVAPCPYSPCARSEKRPRNEVSFRVPGNICFFALMGRKHDAEVEFTCCHSQKSAKVGFSKGFLSDLIGPDRVVDTCRGQPARHCWQDETMVISCKTMHVVVVWWPKLKGVLY